MRRATPMLIVVALAVAACGGGGGDGRSADGAGSTTVHVPTGTDDSDGDDADPLGCLVGEWTSTGYDSEGQTVVAGTGSGMTLRIDADRAGYLDLSTMIPIEIDMSDLGAEAVRIVQEGEGWFELTDADEGTFLTNVVVSGYAVRAEIKLGEEWTEAGPGISMSGATVASGSSMACEGEHLVLTSPGSAYEFDLVSSDPGDIPEIPDDARPVGDDVVAGPPPDWGVDLDACAILDITEITAVFPNAEQPAGEDDLSTQFLRQCTYWEGMFLQAAPTEPPSTVAPMAEAMDADVVEVDGIGDWAFAVISRPDPDFGITESVVMVTAANERGTIRILTWDEVLQGTPEYDGLLSLLELALERL